MKIFLITLLGSFAVLPVLGQKGISVSQAYFPPKGSWETRTPSSLGVDTAGVHSAILFAQQHETKDSRDLAVAQVQDFWREPYLERVGPFSFRGDPTGIIIYKGFIIASWGTPNQVEMTNSVTKSFLSSVIGVAVDKGLIRSVRDTVASYMAPIQLYHPAESGVDIPGTDSLRSSDPNGGELIYPFASPHNRQLTWEVMLRQTSDWEGTLWGKPDWADRPDGPPNEILHRERHTPGTVWKYNDVRVNALALAATNVWRNALPQVLKAYVMDPIGASDTWRWMGYRNAWIVLDGQPVQAVSGGGHWGGGMYINAYDMARFGLLTLHRGNWAGKQIISENWVAQALTPTGPNPGYGYMNWFLNTDRKFLPSAPASAFAHVGNGRNIIYVDPEHDLVIVARWIDSNGMDGVVQRVLGALPRRP